MDVRQADKKPLPETWKILVIDEQEEDFLHLKDALNAVPGHSCIVHWANAYEAGQTALKSEDYDAALVNDHLGARTGVELIKETCEAGFSSPFIFYAETITGAMEAEALQAGASLCLAKSEASPRLLEQTIRYAIQLSQKEHALRIREERFQLASQAVNGVLYDWSLSRDELYQSEGLERVVGYRPGEEPGGSKDWWPRNIHPEDYGYVQSTLQAAIAGEKNDFAYEYRIRHKDGHWVYILDQGYIVRDEKGQAIRVVGMCTDITDRKRAEIQLQESENRFRVALSSAPISVYTTDHHLNITWMYDPHPGFQAEAVLGKRLDETLSGETGKELIAIQQKVLETGQAQRGEIETYEDGEPAAYAYYIDPIRDASGKITGLACAGYDISDRKQAEQDLKRYATELERSNQALQDFAYIASHDLQEPLRKIIAFSDRLKVNLGEFTDENTRDYLARMINAARRMQAMITRLLELSRVSTRGKEFAATNLTAVIEEVVSDLESRIQEVQGQVQVEALPAIEADEMQMRQLFQNLIGNAIKFHKPDAAPLVRISGHVDSRVKPASLMIQVEDNGIGFDQAHAERIFQPFQRLHGMHEYEGTGLGLAICQKIVERHHGIITAQSTPGNGATFVIHLPLKQTTKLF